MIIVVKGKIVVVVFCEGIVCYFLMVGWDNKMIFIVGNGEIVIYFFDLGDV